jgi:hypothetical protein
MNCVPARAAGVLPMVTSGLTFKCVKIEPRLARAGAH